MTMAKYDDCSTTVSFFFCGGGVEWEHLNQNSMPDCQMRKKAKKQPPTQCRACGTINISKYVNNFLGTIPITLILSSLVSGF